MSFEKLDATIRVRSGKGPARRLRQKGLVPAVLYGQGIETTKLALDPRLLVKALAGPKRTNTIIELNISGKSEPCPAMVRDHQFDPVSRELLHVDMLAVALDRQLTVKVPIKLEGRSVGEQLGGTLSKKLRQVPVQCLPGDIPEAICMDVTNLGMAETLHASDLQLPAGTTLLLAPKTPIAMIVAKRVEESAEAAEEGEAPAAAAGEDKPADSDAS